jgi:hypothetical protein
MRQFAVHQAAYCPQGAVRVICCSGFTRLNKNKASVSLPRIPTQTNGNNDES